MVGKTQDPLNSCPIRSPAAMIQRLSSGLQTEHFHRTLNSKTASEYSWLYLQYKHWINYEVTKESCKCAYYHKNFSWKFIWLYSWFFLYSQKEILIHCISIHLSESLYSDDIQWNELFLLRLCLPEFTLQPFLHILNQLPCIYIRSKKWLAVHV